MPSWVVAVIVIILVIGVGVIGYGYFHDRALNRRRRDEMANPPDRAIPGYEAGQQRKPEYVSALQAHRAPGRLPPLSDADRAAAEKATDSSDPVRIGYAHRDFVNDPDKNRAVLCGPMVVICAEPVEAIRELLPVFERARTEHRPIVIVAPGMNPKVLETLAVNRIQQLLEIIVVIATDMDTLFSLGERTGTALIDRSDLQAGYLQADHVGHCGVWVSTSIQTWIGARSSVTSEEDQP